MLPGQQAWGCGSPPSSPTNHTALPYIFKAFICSYWVPENSGWFPDLLTLTAKIKKGLTLAAWRKGDDRATAGSESQPCYPCGCPVRFPWLWSEPARLWGVHQTYLHAEAGNMSSCGSAKTNGISWLWPSTWKIPARSLKRSGCHSLTFYHCSQVYSPLNQLQWFPIVLRIKWGRGDSLAWPKKPGMI